MLGLYVAEAVSALPFDHKLVVTTPNHGCSKTWSGLGYKILINDDSQNGQATSAQIAARFAREVNADALCICLADMPFITASVVEKLHAEFHRLDGQQIVAASNGKSPMPPAIFPARCFEELIALQGDQGARALLSEAKAVAVTETLLIDIDTRDDLRRAEILISE